MTFKSNISNIMEYKPGDYVATPKGNGYVAEIIEGKVLVDLTDGEHQRELFYPDQLMLLAE